MAKYRKLSNPIDAIKFKGNLIELDELQPFVCEIAQYNDSLNAHIETWTGPMIAKPGDYIVKDMTGEIYPCQADFFEATYEKVPFPSEKIKEWGGDRGTGF